LGPVAGGGKVDQVPPLVDELLEYHASTLFPALLHYAADIPDSSLSLERIEIALRGSKFLTDADGPTAADICIGVDLLTYIDRKTLPKTVSSFLEVR
jgi:hypothetical protein